MALFGLWIAYTAAESFLWRDQMWGAHALGFLPPVFAIAALLPVLLLLPGVAREIARRSARWSWSEPWRRWAPVVAGVVTATAFWVLRERHLFWGDALPLSITVPAGQSFHPDEPLTLWIHHTLWELGGGRWLATDTIAFASAVAGGMVAAISARELLRRAPEPGLGMLALAVWMTQGGMSLFHGHVENYAYLSAALIVFLWAGLDYLEGRGPAWPAFAALLVAFALHLLGGLAVVPALVLVVHGIRSRTRRDAMVWTVLGFLATALLAGALVQHWYPSGSPFRQFADGVTRVLTQPNDMRREVLWSWRRAADLWSHSVQMGPLSWGTVTVLALLLAPPWRRWGARGIFLLAAAVACYGPLFLTGEGNLGAARNWDLFAGPALAVSFAGLVLLLETGPRAVAHRLLLAALAASLAQTIPWTALNMDVAATRARIAALPLGHGRSAAMLGTSDMNAGRNDSAEGWFRRALAEDSLNVNAWSGLGLVLARTGRYAEAEPAFRRVVFMKPSVPGYREDLAALYMRQERWAAAAATLQDVLALDPARARAWRDLAEAMRRMGRADSAVYALTAAVGAVGADPELRRALADAYAMWVASAGQRGDVEEFARAWTGFQARYPDDPRVTAWAPRAQAMLSGRLRANRSTR